MRSVLGVESNSFAAITRGSSAASATLKQQQQQHPIRGVSRPLIRVLSLPFGDLCDSIGWDDTLHRALPGNGRTTCDSR